jgi:hypothetical protein
MQAVHSNASEAVVLRVPEAAYSNEQRAQIRKGQKKLI